MFTSSFIRSYSNYSNETDFTYIFMKYMQSTFYVIFINFVAYKRNDEHTLNSLIVFEFISLLNPMTIICEVISKLKY